MPVKRKATSSREPVGEFHRFNVVLSGAAEQMLETLRTAIRKNGFRANKSEIIRVAVRHMASLNLDLSNVKDEDDLLSRVISASKR